MKNRKITYLLILTVFALWGGIVYKIMHGEGIDEQEVNTFISVSNSDTSEISVNMNSMKLGNSSRNPFLLANAGDTGTIFKLTQIRRKQKVLPQHTIKWSDISYIGFTSNINNKYKLAILRISGMECTLGENQSYSGYKVLKILGDSLKIEYRGSRKIIKISQ